MMVDNPTKYDLAFYVDKDTLKKANKWINTCGKEKNLTDYDKW